MRRRSFELLGHCHGKPLCNQTRMYGICPSHTTDLNKMFKKAFFGVFLRQYGLTFQTQNFNLTRSKEEGHWHIQYQKDCIKFLWFRLTLNLNNWLAFLGKSFYSENGIDVHPTSVVNNASVSWDTRRSMNQHIQASKEYGTKTIEVTTWKYFWIFLAWNRPSIMNYPGLIKKENIPSNSG